ncbi:MAG: SMC family ATPase, partial [Caldilineaceae bacterium]|nr:SMC family ATPase [Caldilineaceae bacterium]
PRRQKAVTEAENRLASLQQQLAQVDAVQQSLDAGRARLDEVALALVAAREKQTISQSEAERLKAQGASLQEGDGVRCPVCEQPLDDGHRHDLLARNEAQVAVLRDAWRQAQQTVKDLDGEQKQLQAQTKQHEDTLRRLPRAEEGDRAAVQLDEARRELAQLDAEIETLSAAPDEVTALQRELTDLEHPRRRQEVAAEKAGLRDRTEASLQQIEHSIADHRAALQALQQQIDAFADLDARIQSVNAEIERNRSADDTFRRYEQLASSLSKRQTDAEQADSGLAEAQQMLAKQEAGYAEISGRFDEDAYHKLVAEDEDVRRHLGAIDGQLSEQRRRLDAEQAEIVQLREREDELSAAQTQHAFLQEQHELLSLLRTILREAGPYVTAALVKQISYEAAQIFGEIMQDFTRRLHWDEEYAVTLEVDGYKRQFAQLSGGEQMSAALSVRLALLREMSDINVAFFDEPTTNLDETRRDSLAQQILAIKGFRQLFVISHDDTFEQATENLVRVHKVDGLSVVEATA